MKIALAQIDMRLGDLEAICSRVGDQAELAAARGADLLCAPAPLLGGVVPGSLVDYPNYEHDLVRNLVALAARLEPVGICCLVPGVAPCEGGSLFELFLLRDGRAVPLRTTMLRLRENTPLDPWLPPVFDIAGTRVAATFDFGRDVGQLPPGCDLLLYFQVNAFDATDVTSAPAAAAAQGCFSREVSKAGVWMACMAPVGGFDEAVYTGGSFVMDDAGRVVALAPSFEEALLCQEVRRGETLPALSDCDLPAYNREEWLWEALRLHLRDAIISAGRNRVAVPLSGDLASSLLAVLAVDAAGSRNVIGLLIGRPDALTPAEEAREAERCARARAVAERLEIRLIERPGDDLARLLDRPVARQETARARRDLESYFLVDAARVLSALPLSPLCKTEYAIAADALAGLTPAALAPFGDVYLTELEFLARARNRVSTVLPPELVTLNAVEESMRAIVVAAAASCGTDAVLTGRVEAVLSALEPAQIDGVLEAHVDRNRTFEETPLAARAPEATATLLMLVRRGELARRRMPSAPIVSARSFVERTWPSALAWSDLGRRGAEPQSTAALAEAEIERFSELGEAFGTRAREEILGLLGDVLGVDSDQMRALASEEGQQRIQENLEQFREQLQSAFEQFVEEAEDDGDADPFGAGPDDDPPLFAQN